MSESIVRCGWIIIDRPRQDDGTIKLGTGARTRLRPFEPISQRGDTPITWGRKPSPKTKTIPPAPGFALAS